MTEGDLQETTGWPDDDAARSPRTMGTDERRKNDDHPRGKGGETKLCECAHSFAQRFLNSKRLRCTRHEDEVLWHKAERAVQCADAGIDGQNKVDTDPLSFRSQTVTREKKRRIKTLEQKFALRCCMDCLHRQESTIDWLNESACSKSAVHDSFTINAPLLLLVPRTRIQLHSTIEAVNIIRHRYGSRIFQFSHD